ncbi:MAG: glycoside hydrolase family 2 TIM barrel-domain containing protein [Niallia nealsonii]|nr:glycoside hydrolase family 2 TIM barrel-domain containing protein [Niallia circulans]MCB5237370.1 glycoside hydrolase family 2 [Niallia circulans]MDU1846572.1 glycoside hydrolase family 2 TIM barrel-domain containing protein [Niallia nealsonii]
MSKIAIQEKEKNIGSLAASMLLKEIDGKTIAFQNKIPYPSFEPQNRLVLSLAGLWKKKRFEADHDWSLSYRDAKWIQKTEEEAQGITKSEFDDQKWENHPLPLPENKLTGKEEKGGAETYENGVWYRKTFEIDADWEGKSITLKCLAVSYVSDFWINGKYVGYHEGGYTPFAFDVTAFIKSGVNTITIRVDNPPWTTRVDTVPAQNNDFFNYTGVIHDLYLEATEGIHVARADIVPKNLQGDVEISVTLENRLKQEVEVILKGELFDTDYRTESWLTSPSAESICNQSVVVSGLEETKVVLEEKGTKIITYHVNIENPKLWNIREPNLYVLTVELSSNQKKIDRFATQFGIRTLEAKNANILLNDHPVFLAGVARHEEWPDYGRTASWNRIKDDLLKIADLQVNLIRTAHYPNHIYTFLLLDRIGLPSMSEIPLWQFETSHYQAQETRKISYQMWREMVFSNYNRPSIMLWSTQNESSDVLYRKAYNEKLVKELKETYNDGRLITQSAAADQPGYEDASMEPLDVAGWTMYFGIFHGSTPYEGTRNFIEQAHAKWPDKPIINTEYGIWSNADDSFLEKQVEIYKDVQYALLEKATVYPQGLLNQDGYMAGIDYWTAFDWYVNHNNFYQTMGMYRMDRKTTKPLYEEFVRDHTRLTEKTSGIGIKGSSVKPTALKGISDEEEKGSVIWTLQQPVDLSENHYLVIRVLDKENGDGFDIEIRNEEGKRSSYRTYGVKVNQMFDVYIPLWIMEQSVISQATSIKCSFEKNRSLEIFEMYKL